MSDRETENGFNRFENELQEEVVERERALYRGGDSRCVLSEQTGTKPDGVREASGEK